MSGHSSKSGDSQAQVMHDETPSSRDEEKHSPALENDGENSSESTVGLKLDQHGLPLVPQPSNFKDDPLVSTE